VPGLNESQAWTLIGVFSAIAVGILTIGFGSLRSGMKSEIKSMNSSLIAEIKSIAVRMESGFEAVNRRIDYLDRDVQHLMRKEFGDNPN
jgi:hypothetical protein